MNKTLKEYHELINDNTNLVYYVLSREFGTHIRDEDLIQSGMLGLCLAAQRWDSTKDVKFATYAYKTIHGECLKQFRQRSVNAVVSLDYKASEDSEDTLYNLAIVKTEDYITQADVNRLPTEKLRTIANKLAMGYSQTEIAHQLNVSRSNVHKRVREIRKLLKERVDNGHTDRK